MKKAKEVTELLRVALGLEDEEAVVVENIIRHEVKREIERIIKLSDEIESGGETTFGEWKAFKHFRNTMRDRYLKKK